MNSELNIEPAGFYANFRITAMAESRIAWYSRSVRV